MPALQISYARERVFSLTLPFFVLSTVNDSTRCFYSVLTKIKYRCISRCLKSWVSCLTCFCRKSIFCAISLFTLPNCPDTLKFRIFADDASVFASTSNLKALEQLMSSELKNNKSLVRHK